MNNGIAQIGSRSGRCKYLKVKVQRLLKIVTYILYNLLLSRGCKTRNGNRGIEFLLFLIFTYKFSDIEIIDTKIMSPR